MRLMTAHRILIGSAIGMFAFLTLWELRQGYVSGDVASVLGAAAGAAAATAVLALYYRYRFRS